jgi:hypothetical protein
MAYHWAADTVFRYLTLAVEDRSCWHCPQTLKVCCHRQRRFFTCTGPVQVLCKLCHCPDPTCPGHSKTISPEEETALVMPYWVLGWDVFCWLGHRRFARHWSVPQNVAANKSYGILYAFVLLLVIVITNVSMHGLWSVAVLIIVILLSGRGRLSARWFRLSAARARERRPASNFTTPTAATLSSRPPSDLA